MDESPACRLRRSLLRGATGLPLLTLLGGGLLVPHRVLAADWNRAAFTARNLSDALRAYGAATATDTRDIAINAPEIAENGAKVEVEISSRLADTRNLAVFAEKNPMPLCATLDFAEGVLPYVRIQLKLAESTRLRVVARTGDGRNHVAWREVKVTLGGCGA
ncbi:MAG: thiosulfate oxidation carrier protein SoxY [Azonexus sp.]|nr:thiosulfate oxidation carrier protein SoxY [Betaproteobacteria bacterium]MBK8917270.1 thiosulfate oxidation carrier protein SoxY [Betaproteobacteria bacterium]MBP6035033.1 thiosulfate oxidation carrier protein SoxY [Azonexus sp.]MBP6905989.1 thiosulfate oxidation carrier protein SoxY [Azonexus sp.]